MGLFLICLVCGLPLAGQDRAAAAGNGDLFARGFYADTAGYHAVGRFSSGDREEALRLAKARAIGRVFQEIEKDVLFQEVFLTQWPEFIEVEYSDVKEEADGYTARVRVLIDRNAVSLAEPNYQAAAILHLNQADEVLVQAEAGLREGASQESNLQLARAGRSYKATLDLCRRAEGLLKDLANVTLRSDSGKNLKVLQNQRLSLEQEAGSALDRLDKAERETAKDQINQEWEQTFLLLSQEIEHIEDVVRDHSPLEPFYDLPREQLEAIRIELQGAVARGDEVTENLTLMQERLPEDARLMREKTAFAMTDLDTLHKRLRQMMSEVELELRDPRMARQDRAKEAAAARETLEAVVTYAFLHEPGEYLSLRYVLPFEVSLLGTLETPGKFEFRIMGEGLFPVGVWVRGLFFKEDLPVDSGTLNRSLSSEAAVGFYSDATLYGIGIGWDWATWVDDEPAVREVYTKFFIGGVNGAYNRADWVLSFRYYFPAFLEPLVPVYLVNLGIDGLLRLERILLLEAHLATGAVQSLPASSGVDLKNRLRYCFDWRVSVALRLPPPFSWGFFHHGLLTAPLDSDYSPGASRYDGFWGFFAEYVF